MNVFGPAISGVLVAVAGTGWVFAIDAASFVASAFFLLQLKLPAHARAARSHFIRELHEGFREVTSRSWVSAPIVGFAITNFCVASFIVLGPIVFRDHFGGARNWGIVSACGAIGAIIGGLASVRLHPRRPLSFGFITTMLIGAPIAALAPPLPAIAIAVAWSAGTASVALSNTYWDTALQRNIPEGIFSRVRSYDILVSFVFMPIGFVAFPLISKPLGVEPTLLGAAAIALLTSLAVALVPGVRAVTDADVATPVTATRAA